MESMYYIVPSITSEKIIFQKLKAGGCRDVIIKKEDAYTETIGVVHNAQMMTFLALQQIGVGQEDLKEYALYYIHTHCNFRIMDMLGLGRLPRIKEN